MKEYKKVSNNLEKVEKKYRKGEKERTPSIQ